MRPMKHYRLFPFKDRRLDYIHRNVVACIESPGFRFELPPLPPHVVARFATDRSERARLGFVGDAHIASSIAIELRRCYPEATPGFYTQARMVLVANSTFAHLMKKVGLFKDNDLVKVAGDAFEALLAAFYAERGPHEFQAYIRTYFFPLIITAGHAFRNSRTLFTRYRRGSNLPVPRPLPQRRPMGNMSNFSLLEIHPPKSLTGVISEWIRPGKELVPAPAKSTQPSTSAKAIVPATIDLTSDMDTEDEQTVMLTLLPDRGSKIPSSQCDDMVVDHPASMVPSCSQPSQPTLRLPILRRNKLQANPAGPSRLPQVGSHATPNSSRTGSRSTTQNDLGLYSQQGNNWDNPIVLD